MDHDQRSGREAFEIEALIDDHVDLFVHEQRNGVANSQAKDPLLP